MLFDFPFPLFFELSFLELNVAWFFFFFFFITSKEEVGKEHAIKCLIALWWGWGGRVSMTSGFFSYLELAEGGSGSTGHQICGHSWNTVVLGCQGPAGGKSVGREDEAKGCFLNETRDGRSEKELEEGRRRVHRRQNGRCLGTVFCRTDEMKWQWRFYGHRVCRGLLVPTQIG